MTPEASAAGVAPTAEAGGFACTFCGSATVADRGRMTLWAGERLLVLEGVPARSCPGCNETFYGADVAARVERLQTSGPGDGPEPRRVVEAPVYAWEDL